MNTNEFIYSIPSFIEKSKENHMSQAVIDTNKWIAITLENIVFKTIFRKLV